MQYSTGCKPLLFLVTDCVLHKAIVAICALAGFIHLPLGPLHKVLKSVEAKPAPAESCPACCIHILLGDLKKRQRRDVNASCAEYVSRTISKSSHILASEFEKRPSDVRSLLHDLGSPQHSLRYAQISSWTFQGLFETTPKFSAACQAYALRQPDREDGYQVDGKF